MISVKDVDKTKDIASNRTKKSNSSGEGFSLLLNQVSKPTSNPISGPSSISITDGVLAAQVSDDDEEVERRKKLVKRASVLLDKLEEIRSGLLTGYISKDKLIEISRFVKETRFDTKDEKLMEIVSDIELRVEVELAKLMK